MIDVMEAPMAKKKPKPKVSILHMRGSEKWKDWIDEVAAADSRTVSSLVEQALKMYAKQLGITKEPPER